MLIASPMKPPIAVAENEVQLSVKTASARKMAGDQVIS